MSACLNLLLNQLQDIKTGLFNSVSECALALDPLIKDVTAPQLSRLSGACVLPDGRLEAQPSFHLHNNEVGSGVSHSVCPLG